MLKARQTGYIKETKGVCGMVSRRRIRIRHNREEDGKGREEKK